MSENFTDNFENVIKPRFQDLATKIENNLGIKDFAREAKIVQGKNRKISSGKILTLEQNCNNPVFTFDPEEFQYLDDEVKSYLPNLEQKRAEEGTFSLYIGGGLGKFALNMMIKNQKPRKRNMTNELYEILSSHAPMGSLFLDLYEEDSTSNMKSSEDFEHLASYMLDSTIQLINGWRIGMYYYRQADDPKDETTKKVKVEARDSLKEILTRDLHLFKEIGAIALGQNVECSEKAFIWGIPEWLFAVAQPMNDHDLVFDYLPKKGVAANIDS